jgi:hypothetical protein
VFAHGDPLFVIPVTKKYNLIFWFKLKAIALIPILLRINKVCSQPFSKNTQQQYLVAVKTFLLRGLMVRPKYLPIIGSMLVSLLIKFGT